MTIQQTQLQLEQSSLLQQVVGLTNYSLSNRHAEFQIFEGGVDTAGYHNEEGLPRLREGIARGFLATRWLKPADLKLGLLMADTSYYKMHCSDRLIDVLTNADVIRAIRAICSFQILEDGSKRVICQVFYKTPFVK